MEFNSTCISIPLEGETSGSPIVWELTGWEAALQKRLRVSGSAASWAWANSLPWKWRWPAVSWAVINMGTTLIVKRRDYPSLISTGLTTARYCVQFWIHTTRKTLRKWNKVQGGPPSLLEAGVLALWGEAEGLVFLQPGEETMAGETQCMPICTFEEVIEKMQAVVHKGRDNWHKLNQERFRLDMRRNFFSIWEKA